MYANFFISLQQILEIMTTSLFIDRLEVQQVKQAVAARFGKEPHVPSDFAVLSLAIEQTTGQTLNADTLSRIWGYKKGYSTVRKNTIDILRTYADAHVESDFVYSQVVHADNLTVGTQVELAWLPDRHCVIEYMGEWRWKVIEVANSKLHVGNTFSCRSIAISEPLLVDYLCTEEGTFDAYQIGGKNGLTLVRLL